MHILLSIYLKYSMIHARGHIQYKTCLNFSTLKITTITTISQLIGIIRTCTFPKKPHIKHKRQSQISIQKL